MPHPATLPPPLTKRGKPQRQPPTIWRDGREFCSLPELARRRGTSRWAASKLAKHHPEACTQHNGHTYCQEIDA